MVNRDWVRTLLGAGMAMATACVISACTIDRPMESASGAEPAHEKSVERPAENEDTAPKEPPTVSVSDGSTDVDPSVPVTVTTAETGLDTVTMTNESGKVVESAMSDDGNEWTTTEVLGYNRTYTVVAEDKNGETTEVQFSTSTPAVTTNAYLTPIPDSTVGIGQSINFIFDSAPQDRWAVQEAITITSSNDTVGAFYWVGPTELRWRPQEFWEPGTEVSVEADIYGVDMGGGLYGAADNASTFTIGDDVRAVVDDAAKTMDVYRNGELLRSLPVSLGRDGGRWATPNGVYVVGDQHESLLMDSATFGLGYDEGAYQTPVNYATQLSYSGIYVHGAPWSEWAQGNTNTSHGCINVTDSDAAWFQSVVKRGDPVVVKNTTGGTLPAWDGLGQWNMDWETWSAGNADPA